MSEESLISTPSNSSANAAGERLISFGAALVAGSWVAFDVFAEEYFVTTVAVALALLILFLPRIDVGAITDIAPVPVFLKAAGYALAAVGAVEIVDEVRAGIFDAGGATIAGALIAYAGYGLALLGTQQS